jgi:hypothetical protein
MEAYPDVRSCSFPHSEGLEVAVFRRSGDEIHPWLLNGDFRPVPAIRAWEANVCF